MSAAEEARADEARSALASDVREIKAIGEEAVANATAKLPWILGAAGGLAVIGIFVSARLRRRAFVAHRRSLFGSALRAAALSGVAFLARRWTQRAIDRALPEPPSRTAELTPRPATESR